MPEHPRAPARPSTAHDFNSSRFAEVATWVRTRLGIVFSPEQKEQFADRLRTFLNLKNLTAEQLLAALERHDAALSRELAEVVSTNYTFFMRESDTFEFMRQTILPALPDAPFRIWSAASSSGDEAYTAAIHCIEHFGADAQRRVKILGTDISQRQVEHAEAGIYPAEQLSLINSHRRERFFVPTDHARKLRVTQPLRDMCTFRRMNLTQFPWPFEHRFQIIFLRNVLYYFDRAIRSHVLERCYDAAQPGAYLLTSLTEPLLDVKSRWRRVAPAIFQKREF